MRGPLRCRGRVPLPPVLEGQHPGFLFDSQTMRRRGRRCGAGRGCRGNGRAREQEGEDEQQTLVHTTEIIWEVPCYAPACMTGLAVDAEKLGRRYGRRWALADVSFQVQAGTVVMVTGANGSGKSTLLRILASAIRADAGNATVLGFDLRRDREDVRKGTALLSHHSYLYETLTAVENLRVAADHMRVSRDSLPSLLGRVGLQERSDDAVSTFSAGMRKRLSFARILLQAPRLARLDEPYAQLDPAGFDLVDDVVSKLKADGATVLIATHQLERTGRLADAALHLEGGRLR